MFIRVQGLRCYCPPANVCEFVTVLLDNLCEDLCTLSLYKSSLNVGHTCDFGTGLSG